MTEGDDVQHHTDPRARRRHELAPPVDALAAAVRLDAAMSYMRERQLEDGPEPLEDEPPTGLIDLAAIRAAVAAGGVGDDVDPAAAAWLAGGPDPAAARVVEQVDQLEHVLERPPPLELITCADLLTSCTHPGPHVPVGLDGLPAVVDEVTIVTPELAAAVVELAPSPGPTSAAPTVPPPTPPTSVDKGYSDDATYRRVMSEAAVPAPRRVFSSEHQARPGWSSRHDPCSLAYGVRALGAAPLQNVDLPLGPVLDQGQEGECVGCGTVDATNVLRRLAGRSDLLGLPEAAALYHRAQQLDDVPGADYSGTSVLAGMQAAVEAGWFSEYLWAFGTRDIAAALGHGRPVVIGVPWLSGMYDTGPGGLVEVKGEDRGEGHCLVVAKLRLKGPQGQPGPYFGWLNSWGRKYGDNGVGWVHHRDLARLLHGSGEAAIPGALR